MANSNRLQVATGVVVNPENQVLIALRPPHVHVGGLWEFPGGKVDPGEALPDALIREFKEEIGIELLTFEPFMTVDHAYEDRHVFLNVFWIAAFKGEARGQEGQTIRWVLPTELDALPFPGACLPIIQKIKSRLKNANR